MSTLTSSTSPAASPRTFGFQVPASPRRSFALYARPATATDSKLAPDRSPSVPHIGRNTPSPRAVPIAVTTSRYANASTQYSPTGSPPTSRRHIRTTPSDTSKPGLPISDPQKRKGTPNSLSSSPSAMTDISRPPQITGPADAPSKHLARSAPEDSSASAEALRKTPTEPQEARSTHGHSSAPKRSRPEPGQVRIMPIQYETCNAKDLGVLVSNMLMELIRLNDQIPLRDGRLTRFHSRAPPGISVSDYLQRLIQHATLSPPILLSMVHYIDRLCSMYPAFTINSLTVHRFLITAATVASKGLSDSFWTNPTYARIGGIPVSELATLELEFLQRVQWKIVPQPEVLEDYYRSLVERTQGFELERHESDSSSEDPSDQSDDEKTQQEKSDDARKAADPD